MTHTLTLKVPLISVLQKDGFFKPSHQFNAARCGEALSEAPRIADCFAGMETGANVETTKIKK